MDRKLFEFLLNSSENESLDFKSQQYEFINADNGKKSELLKDILAFANAWRRTDAYILIGVIDGKGKLSSVNSINSHIDDAALQQFVNSKTNSPINFSYIPHSYDNKDVGIIKIPIQKRPFYLIKNFGKLNKEVVYIRRGSSTSIATIDEISRMGGINQFFPTEPEIIIEFSEDHSNKRIGLNQEVISNNLFLQDEILPDFLGESNDYFSANINPVNRDFFRDLFEYISLHTSVKPISFFLKNVSDSTAYNLNIIIKIQKTDDINILSETEFPPIPKKYISILSVDISRNIIFPNVINEGLIEDLGTFYKITSEIGNLQPKAEFWIDKLFYVSSSKSSQHKIDINIFADNLPNPISTNFTINFSIKNVSVNLDDLIDIYNEEIKKTNN